MSHWYWSFENGLPVASRDRAGQLLHPPRKEHPLHDASDGSGCVTHSPIRAQSSAQGVPSIGNDGSRSITQWLALPNASTKNAMRPAPHVYSSSGPVPSPRALHSGSGPAGRGSPWRSA
jgi:hypothetical protein